MKRRITSFLLMLFVALFSFSACDSDDGVSSGSLAGNYVLNYMMDKLNSITYYAGQATQVNGVEVTMTGDLTLTENTYSMVLTTVISSAGGTQTETMTETGSYTTSNSSITVTPSDGGETSTSTYSLTNNQLIFENDEFKFVFDKR